MFSVEHAKFAASIFHELEIPGIFSTCNYHILRIYTFRESCQFFGIEDCLSEQLQSCDGLKFDQMKAHLFIQDQNHSTHYFEINVLTRGVINS